MIDSIDVRPAEFAATITPNDSTDLSHPSRALFVGGAGNVAVIMARENGPVTIAGVVAGSVLNIAVKRVMSTNTTATNIVALW